MECGEPDVRPATLCGQTSADDKHQQADNALHHTVITPPMPRMSHCDARLGRCSGMTPDGVAIPRAAAYSLARCV